MITVEGNSRFYMAGLASLVEEDREIAWAQPHITRQADLKWILGNFVQADNPNSNGHIVTAADLKEAMATIPNKPLNINHAPNRRVGVYTAAEMVYPTGENAAGEPEPPIVEALAAFWHYYEPEIYPAIQMAHKEGQLFFCVDPETELLTADGWKSHVDLVLGEDILTLNTDSGLSEWTPLEAVNAFHRDGEMVRMEGLMHSSLTTPNHRWWVKRHSPKTKRDNWEWRTSETLTQQTYIPRAVAHGDFPALAKYSDELVELAAWFWTEGTVAGKSGVIYQSATTNAPFCDRIAAVLTRLYGAPARVRDGGLWYETDHPYCAEHPVAASGAPGFMRSYHLSSAATAPLVEIGGKLPTSAFIRSLTESQLRLFVQTSLDADGDRSASGQLGIKQKDRAGLRMLEMACALLGLPTNTRPSSNGTSRMGIVQRSDFINPHQAAARTKARRSDEGFTITTESYKGVVWCPTTRNGTFFARRNGSTYWTGNSMETVPQTITCKGRGSFAGCDKTFEYAGRQSPTYCDHLNESASRKVLHKPHYTAGALIVPPVRPGWKHADIKEITSLIEADVAQAERIYNEVAAAIPHEDPNSWERIMSFMLATGRG